MSVKTSSESINILNKYLSDFYYVKFNIEDVKSLVYYNMVVFDILSVVPYEFNSEIPLLSEFCDYITIVSDTSTKAVHTDLTVGIIYIDDKTQDKNDSIVISRLPTLKKVLPEKRIHLLKNSSLKGIHRPFWEQYSYTDQVQNQNKKAIDNQKLEKGKVLMERAVQNYCKENNIAKEDIPTLNVFVDHIIPDIFKYKMTVPEEQQIREEAAHPDTLYPEVLLKLVIKMGLLD